MATQLVTTETPEVAKFSLMQRQAQLFASSPLIPESLRKGTPQQAMANCYIAMTIADRMGEDRMTVMQNIHIIHGNAGFKTKYMIARANASGKFKDDIDWEVTGQGDSLSATAFATLAKSGRRVEITVDMAMAKAEGWTKNSKYQTMPEVMLRYRSASFLVNLYAPEVMLGYQTIEEVEDVALSAIPTEAPLTGQALLEQAKVVVTETVTHEPEGKPNADTGELVTLDGAKDMIDQQTTVADVNRLFDSLRDAFDDAEADELRNFAAERCEAIMRAEGGSDA